MGINAKIFRFVHHLTVAQHAHKARDLIKGFEGGGPQFSAAQKRTSMKMIPLLREQRNVPRAEEHRLTQPPTQEDP